MAARVTTIQYRRCILSASALLSFAFASSMVVAQESPFAFEGCTENARREIPRLTAIELSAAEQGERIVAIEVRCRGDKYELKVRGVADDLHIRSMNLEDKDLRAHNRLVSLALAEMANNLEEAPAQPVPEEETAPDPESDSVPEPEPNPPQTTENLKLGVGGFAHWNGPDAPTLSGGHVEVVWLASDLWGLFADVGLALGTAEFGSGDVEVSLFRGTAGVVVWPLPARLVEWDVRSGWRSGLLSLEGVAASANTTASSLASLWGGPMVSSGVTASVGPVWARLFADVGWTVATVGGEVEGERRVDFTGLFAGGGLDAGVDF